VRTRDAAARGGLVAAACVACCAPPIIAAVGLTAGIAATAGIFLGLAAAVGVVLLGVAWITNRRLRHDRHEAAPTAVPVPAPTQRADR
jgi:chromate transport protein ChrA